MRSARLMRDRAMKPGRSRTKTTSAGSAAFIAPAERQAALGTTTGLTRSVLPLKFTSMKTFPVAERPAPWADFVARNVRN
jgi:hypothetical protein